MRWCMAKTTVCDLERGGDRWASKSDHRWRTSALSGLNRYEITKTAGLGCSENFVGQREELVLNTFFDLQLVNLWRDLRKGETWENLGALKQHEQESSESVGVAWVGNRQDCKNDDRPIFLMGPYCVHRNSNRPNISIMSYNFCMCQW